MEKTDYIFKTNQILGEATKFHPVSQNNNEAQLQKFQQFLYRLKNRKAISKEVYNRI